MPYSISEQERLKYLLMSVEDRKPHSNAAPTFEDSPALSEIRTLVEARLSESQDREVLEDSVAILRYLADAYEAMNKVAYAVKLYRLLLETEIEFIVRCSADKDQLKDDFYHAVRARNYYGKDKCEDLTNIVISILGEEETAETVNSIYINYPHLKRDPVELTDEYLAVIDDVEKKIAKTRNTDICHEFWSLKRQYLAGYGIKWSSPSELNPNTRFD